MKFQIVLLGLLGLVAYSTQVPKLVLDNCKEDIKLDKESCLELFCSSFVNETVSKFDFHFNTCPFIWPVCKNGTFHGETDYEHEKMYPDCCPKAICK